MNAEQYLQHIDFQATKKLDFTPLFIDPKIFRALVLDLCRPYRKIPIDKVACPEALGFVLGSAVAAELKKGLVLIRKAGRLPNIRQNVASQSFADYTGEKNSFEVNKKLITQGDRVLLIDDWVETGGQLKGLVKLLEKRGAEISGISVLGFNRAPKVQRFANKYPVSSIVDYELTGRGDLSRRLDER